MIGHRCSLAVSALAFVALVACSSDSTTSSSGSPGPSGSSGSSGAGTTNDSGTSAAKTCEPHVVETSALCAQTACDKFATLQVDTHWCTNSCASDSDCDTKSGKAGAYFCNSDICVAPCTTDSECTKIDGLQTCTKAGVGREHCF